MSGKQSRPGPATLGDAGGGIPLGQISERERRRAAVSVAEAAIAGGWQDELRDVLEHLGLGEVSR